MRRWLFLGIGVIFCWVIAAFFLLQHNDRDPEVTPEDFQSLHKERTDEEVEAVSEGPGPLLATITPSKNRKGVRSVAFSPDGKTLISEWEKGTIHLWEVSTGKQKRVYEDYSGAVLSPNGKDFGSYQRSHN